MKKRIGKIVGLVCMVVLALVLGFHIDVNEVQAETTNSENIIACDGGTFHVEPVSADTAVIDGKTIPKSTEQPDWLFAGWFLDDTCKQAVKQKIDGVETYYAKFVPAEVLGVKLQVGHNAAYSDTTNMRIVSSVDSLDYASVGFEVYFNTKIGTNTTSADICSEKVFERITTGSQSGITYNYSPQIIDADSKYFVTATLINIKKASYEKPFHIVPYWTTYDGVKVYGQSRYVTIKDDAFDNSVANFPVKIEAETGDTVSLTTKASATPTEATVLYHDGTYAHLRVNKPTVSLTKYTVTNASSEEATVYYRNFNTKYAGTSASADTSWYDAYKDENNNVSRTKFVIATSADLYGLASVSLENDGLINKTVYMVTDIQANKGASTTSGWKKAAGDGTQYDWTPVGTADVPFQGAFDGNGFKIDGICISAQSTAYMGLFAYADGCTISNLYLMNSYMNSTLNSGNAEVGGFVGSGAGIFNNLYSNAIICTKKPRVGGIMGSTSSSQKNESSMTNCWFDGKIILNGNGQYANCGGILGAHFKGTVDMKNCLFTGEINATSSHSSNFDSRVGGVIGTANSGLTLNMTNCLSAGTINVLSSKGLTPSNYGPVHGKLNNTPSVTYVYATQESTLTGVEQIDLTGQDDVESTVSIDNALSAFNATEPLWSKTSIRGGNMLIPRCFSGNTIANTPDTSWYNGANATAGTQEDPYVLRNSNDLYGLAYLVNNEIDLFAGKYIVLVDDIKLNDGDANDWDKNAPAYEWTPIGTSTTNTFSGILNGNGHEISGMYINTTATGAGLFGYAANCTISNLYLVNSYITSTNTDVGSIIAQGDGTLTNVYSDAIIHTSNYRVGGLVGRSRASSESALVLNNCWFDGTITSTRSAKQALTGGLLGFVLHGTATIDSCLFTGTINVISTYSSASDSRAGGIIASSNKSLDITLSNTLSAGTINVVNNGSGSISNVGSVAGWVRHEWNVSNVYVSTDSYEIISNYDTTGVPFDEKVSTVDLSDSNSISSCLAALNAKETTWEVRTLRNRTMPVPKNFKHFEHEDATPVCKYDSELSYDGAEGGLRIYIPSKKGYINYNFVHSVSTEENSDMWRLSVASLTDYNKNHIKDITESGAEWEMAIRLVDRDDFIGGYVHGDEKFDSIEVIIDEVPQDITAIQDYQAFDEMKIVVTSVGYDPLDHTTAVLNHHKEYVVTQNGIELNQTVEWLGEYTLDSTLNSYLAMMPPLKYATSDSTDIITDCYYVTNDGIPSVSTSLPESVSRLYVDTSDSNCESFCVYGIDSGVYFTMGQTGEEPLYSETRSFIHDNSGRNYHKMYTSFAKGDVITSGTVWSATTTYRIDWK